LAQLRRDLRQIGRGVDALRHRRNAVEIRADPRVVDSGHARCVLDVVDQRFQWRTRDPCRDLLPDGKPLARARGRVVLVFRRHLRESLLHLWAEYVECDAITGARVTSIVSKNVLSATCEMSTSIPMRFISATACLPSGVRPPWCGTSGLSTSP